jgi:hypothetical protein
MSFSRLKNGRSLTVKSFQEILGILIKDSVDKITSHANKTVTTAVFEVERSFLENRQFMLGVLSVSDLVLLSPSKNLLKVHFAIGC